MGNMFVNIAFMIGTMALSRMVNTSDPNTLFYCRVCYVIEILLEALLFYYIKSKVIAKNDQTKIYFETSILGQEQVKESTYVEHESQICSQSMTGSLTGIFMTLFLMSYKFGMHYGLVMQLIRAPFNLYGNVLVKKHLLNQKVENAWKEKTEKPLSLQSEDDKQTLFRDNITKTWDDGELAKYDFFTKMVSSVDINTVTQEGWSLLMIILGNPLGDMKIVKTLISKGMNPSLQDNEGWTALHWSAYHNNVGGAEALFEAVGDQKSLQLLSIRDHKGRTAYDVAKENNSEMYCNWIRTYVNDSILFLQDTAETTESKKIADKFSTDLVPLLKE